MKFYFFTVFAGTNKKQSYCQINLRYKYAYIRVFFFIFQFSAVYFSMFRTSYLKTFLYCIFLSFRSMEGYLLENFRRRLARNCEGLGKKISHLLEPEINDVEIQGKTALNLREKMINNYILTEKKCPFRSQTAKLNNVSSGVFFVYW